MGEPLSLGEGSPPHWKRSHQQNWHQACNDAIQSHCLSESIKFAKSAEQPETDIAHVEDYLVLVWAGARSNKQKCYQLLLHCHTSVSAPTAVTKKPPASSIVRRHMTRGFFVVRGIVAVR